MYTWKCGCVYVCVVHVHKVVLAGTLCVHAECVCVCVVVCVSRLYQPVCEGTAGGGGGNVQVCFLSLLVMLAMKQRSS